MTPACPLEDPSLGTYNFIFENTLSDIKELTSLRGSILPFTYEERI